MIWLPIVGNYADVDVYAAILAYANLLQQQGKSAKVYIPMAPNYSVPDELRLAELENAQFDFAPNDQAIILDVSNPEAIHRFVTNEQILELVDHHAGHEDYWEREIGDRAIIEPVGAVATLIFERWSEDWQNEKMPKPIAKLLLAAILDNTLNFNTANTTERDRRAAQKLAKIIGVTVEKFAGWYFSTVSETIMQDPEAAVFADNKLLGDLGAYQLTLWEAREILPKLEGLREKFNHISPNWFLNIISIAEKRNYIFASPQVFEQKLVSVLDLEKLPDNILASHRLYLRKEILALI